MQRGANVPELNKLDNIRDINQNRIKMKNNDLINDINIKTNTNINDLLNNIKFKTKTSLNENKTLNIKNQNTDCLIEYFEGIMLSYIGLYEAQGKRMDKLKNLILNHNKKNIKGGTIDTKINIYKYNWDKMNIKVDFDYRVFRNYIITIQHNNQRHNDFNMEIDLYNNKIKIEDKRENYEISSDIYTDTCIITKFLEIILEQLLEQDYYYIDKCIIKNTDIKEYPKINPNDPKEPEIKFGEGDKYTIYKGIISLLIMILTLRKKDDENIYRKYNTTYLLSGICKYYLLRNFGFDKVIESTKLFMGVTNNNCLTYVTCVDKDDELNHYISFNGDCSFNTLVCSKNSDIRELILEKIHCMENNNIDHNKNDEYYINKINNLLDEFEIVGRINYKELIKDRIKKYKEFTDYLTNKEYFKKINTLRNMRYQLDLNQWKNNMQTESKKILNYCNQYIIALRNNLMNINIDKNQSNYIFKEINTEYTEIKNYIDNYYNESNDYEGVNLYYEGVNLLGHMLEKITKICKDSFNMYYINILTALLILKHKIDHLYNDNIMKILKYSQNKNIIKCFKNIGLNRNEDIIFPSYQKGYGQTKYLFLNGATNGYKHAILIIINLTTKYIYIYDTSYLNIYYSEKLNVDNLEFNIYAKHQTYHPLKIENKRWFLKVFEKHHNDENEYYYDVDDYYYHDDDVEEDEEEEFHEFYYPEKEGHRNINQGYKNLNFIKIWKYSDNYYNIISNYYKLDLGTYNSLPVFDQYGSLDLKSIIDSASLFQNDDLFEKAYNNIKKGIFDQIIIYYNKYITKKTIDNNKGTNDEDIEIASFIIDFITNNIIENNKCSIREALFKFIECLIKAKFKKEYKTITKNNINKVKEIKQNNPNEIDNYLYVINGNNFTNNICINNYNRKYIENINMDKKYLEAANCFTDTYKLNISQFLRILNDNTNIDNETSNSLINNDQNLNNIINNIIDTLSFEIEGDAKINITGSNNIFDTKFNGGNTDISCYNNSIIKKVLIVLLIILIIIIIVLIVLYIINKYKNNDDFK